MSVNASKTTKGGEDLTKAVFTAKEVSEMLDINLPKTYELLRAPGFPAVWIGRRVIIPKDAFFRWLNDAAGQVLDA